MQTRFKVSRQGQDLGSFSREEIAQRLKSEDFAPSDRAFLPEKEEWVPVPEFVRSHPPALEAPPLPAQAPAAPELPPAPSSAVSSMAPSADEGTAVTSLTGVTVIAHPAKPPPQAPLKTPPRPPPQASPETTPEKDPARQKADVEGKLGKVSLKGGVGTIEFRHFTAGKLKLSVAGHDKTGLAAEAPHEIVIKGAQAVKLVALLPTEITAGEKTNVAVEAQDKWGNRDPSYTGSAKLRLAAGAELGTVKVHEGRGTAVFSIKRAGAYAIQLLDSADSGLDVSAVCEFKCVAGPAVKLILSSPEETVAGQPVHVQVKAVDRYGNLATTCNDDIELEVASPQDGMAPQHSPRKAG